MPITKTQDIVEELELLRTEIAATRQEIRILAELLGVGDRFDQAQQESEHQQRQQRRQEFLDSVPDTKIDCPPVPANIIG
jgi:hypothetical protein